MNFDSEHFANRTQELDFYRCLTAEQLQEEHDIMDALFAQMAAEEALDEAL